MRPTDEHLLPVLAALGAANDDYQLGIQSLGTYQRVLAMTNYVFASSAQVAQPARNLRRVARPCGR